MPPGAAIIDPSLNSIQLNEVLLALLSQINIIAKNAIFSDYKTQDSNKYLSLPMNDAGLLWGNQ